MRLEAEGVGDGREMVVVGKDIPEVGVDIEVA